MRIWPHSMTNSGQRYTRLTFGLVALAILCLPLADLEIFAVEPWFELKRMALGFIHPDLQVFRYLLPALGQTVAFALLAVAGAALIGLLAAIFFHWRIIRWLCAATHAVHELFWGLLFMQVFGLSATTGLLAILVPFAGTFGKMYAEIFEQQSTASRHSTSVHADRISLAAYTWVPQSWPALVSYTRYRFECALRSSTILGFIGLPTLGFYLETAFSQGNYGESALLLIVFYLLIASIRWWMQQRLLLVYLVAAILLMPDSPSTHASLWTFLSQDIWPQALRAGDWSAAAAWYQHQLFSVALPATVNTLVLSQIALVGSGALALLMYGFASPKLFSATGYRLGHLVLLILRSTPEMVLAFVLLLLLGPSMLPAITALSLHNGGLIGYLLAKQSETLKLRPDAPQGLNLFGYELTPRLYSHFLSLLLYRWEVIMRESAILGILGVTSLGFYIDSAFEDIRYDRAAFLIAIAALLNIGVDALSRRLRSLGHLSS